jgi:hypothetical protein
MGQFGGGQGQQVLCEYAEIKPAPPIAPASDTLLNNSREIFSATR